MGAIGVIIGLYIVLWGKTEDIVDVKEKVDPKSMVNATEEIHFLKSKSCGKSNCKLDLEQPLLDDEFTVHN
jgi:S-ribosylhomocysteine lyase LuxS involved in autoinducer biosynthesis